jgi:hypothetical protein
VSAEVAIIFPSQMSSVGWISTPRELYINLIEVLWCMIFSERVCGKEDYASACGEIAIIS